MSPRGINPKYDNKNMISIKSGYYSQKVTRNKILVSKDLNLVDTPVNEVIDMIRKASEGLENAFLNEDDDSCCDYGHGSLSIWGLRNPTKEEQLKIDKAWAKRDADLIPRRKKQKEKELEVSRIREEKDQEEYLRLKERFENER